MSKITRFFDDMKLKNVAFIGTGVSHTELISLFRDKGIAVTVLDKRSADKFQETYDMLSAKGVEFRLGEDYLDSLTDFDVVFRTPGMYFNNPALTKAREAGVVITSEMETFFDLCPCRIYAVTGSDGKSTSTTLIAEILAASGKTVHKGGNIGRALLPIIEQISEDDAAVVELSSFQLISMRKSPDTALITNITPNHLDVHGTMEEYTECKTNLITHQNGFSRTVLNLDNEEEGEMVIGSAGGVNLTATLEYKEVETDASDAAVKVTLSGLLGGHSGCEIHVGRCNANKTMARLVQDAIANFEACLVSWKGGNMRNAIPREAEVVLTLPKENVSALAEAVAEWKETFQAEYGFIEPSLSLTMEEVAHAETMVPSGVQDNLVNIQTRDGKAKNKFNVHALTLI